MKISHAIAVSFTLLTTTNAVLADPTSYPLLCNGGTDMRIMTNHDVDNSGIPGATSMYIYFKPASQPGSTRKPLPGECAWLDRAFRLGEPAVMRLKSSKIEFSFQVNGKRQIVVDSTGPLLSVEGLRRSAEARDWQYLVDGAMKGRLFTAHVYNAGRVMAVTKVRP